MYIHHRKKKAYKFKPERRGQKSQSQKPPLYWTKNFFALGVIVLTIFVIFPYDIVQSYREYSNSIYKKLNLHVSDIQVFGADRLSIEEIKAASEIKIGTNIYDQDLEQSRVNIEKKAWVEKASIQRVLPSSINIIVTERIPKAIFFAKGRHYLIDDAGNLLEEVTDKSLLQSYLLVEGSESNLGYSDLLDAVYEMGEVYNNIVRLTRHGSRRWDITLKNGSLIKLPEKNLQDALNVLSRIEKENKLLVYPVMIDLRFTPHKIYVKF